MPYPPGRAPLPRGHLVRSPDSVSCTIPLSVDKNSLYNLPNVLTIVSCKYPLSLFRAISIADLEQDVFSRVGWESRVSHPTLGLGANSDAYHFGPSTEDEMEADLKRIDAMEEDQEVTSRFQAGFMMGELQSLAIPNSVIPSKVKFISYENMKRSVTCSPEAM